MRKLALAALLCAPAAARSQEAPPATVEDYVCAFAGECADATADDSGEAAAPAPGGPRVSATRGFSLSTPARPRPGAAPAGARRAAARPGAVARQPAGPGRRVNLSLAFETGSAKLTAAAEAQARIFGQSLMLPQLATMRFRIEGHTDSVGSRAGNLVLSQRRAQSVADLLIGMGVPRERLDVIGYGPDRPLPGTRASDGENRRVEAVRTS